MTRGPARAGDLNTAAGPWEHRVEGRRRPGGTAKMSESPFPSLYIQVVRRARI